MICETGCALNSLCLKGELRTEYLIWRLQNWKGKSYHLSYRRQGNIWAQNYSLFLGYLHASCSFYIMLKWAVGIWRIWANFFLLVIELAIKGHKSERGRTVEEKEGQAQDFKESEHLILMAKGLVYLIFVRRTQTNILKCKETSVLK